MRAQIKFESHSATTVNFDFRPWLEKQGKKYAFDSKFHKPQTT
jgi:hypothetical protein